MAAESAGVSSQSPVEIVSGDAEPKFGVAELSEVTTGNDDTPEPQADVGPEPEAEEHPVEDLEVEGLDEDFERFLTGPEEPEQTPDDDDDDTSGLEELGERAQGRIKRLVDRVKQGEQQNHALTAQLQQASNAFQQLQNQNRQSAQQNHQLQVQMARMMERINAFEKYGQQRQQPPQDEDPGDRLLRELKEKTLSELQQQQDPRYKQLAGQFQQLQQRMQQQERQRAEQMARMRAQVQRQRTSGEATQATMDLFGDHFPEDIRDGIADELGGLAIALAYGKGVPVSQGAQMLGKILNQYSVGKHRAYSARKRGHLDRSQSVNQPPASGGVRMSNRRRAPTQQEAEKAGYKDPLEAAMAQRGMVLAKKR